MICGAIFDIDGVLLDSMTIWRDLAAAILKDTIFNPKTDLTKYFFR